MIGYAPGCDVGPLEEWPMTAAASDYVILRGAPRTFGRLDAGGSGHVTRFGIWRCTPGAFQCTEQGDELMTVLSGRCVLTDHGTGEKRALRAGDSLFLRDGSRVTWDVTEELTKVFFGQKPGGY
ncbi:cupin domain-containing protein [Roseovarius sp. S4756]|uniref:cupin domain-containing protein n=1 Tax=Roseovarius maritimus TaxID=3342637 RepID=UPI0037263ACF